MYLGLTKGKLVVEMDGRLTIIATMKGTRFVNPVTNFITKSWWRVISRWFDNRYKSVTS